MKDTGGTKEKSKLLSAKNASLFALVLQQVGPDASKKERKSRKWRICGAILIVAGVFQVCGMMFVQSIDHVQQDKDGLLTAKLLANQTAQNEEVHAENKEEKRQQPIQCEMPENRTIMFDSWLKLVAKDKQLPAGGQPPQEGVFLEEWAPVLDCPSSLTTLTWLDQRAGIVSCPSDAPMYTFYHVATFPTSTHEGTAKVVCSSDGRYTLDPGWGLLYGNSMRTRPAQNQPAVERSRQLLEKRKTQPQTTNGKPPHILLYMLDAISRPSFYRALKATQRSIQDIKDRQRQIGTNVFEFGRHHSVGGSSIRNLTPMLTGLLLDSLDSKKGKYEAFIFEELRRSGYISMNMHNSCNDQNVTFGDTFNNHAPERRFPFAMEDIDFFGPLFCQPGKGSKGKPLKIEQACAKTPDATECFPSNEKMNIPRTTCLGGRSRMSVLLEQYLHSRDDHEGAPSFAFVHDYDLHDFNHMTPFRYDQEKAQILPKLEHVLKDTIVILISDHGNQGKIATTQQGAWEYKMPIFYMFVPEYVLHENKGWKEALEANQHVLTSPRDVHETMLHLAGGRDVGDVEWWQQHGHDKDLAGSSLLNPLPFNRTCTDAGIPEMECICGGTREKEVPKNSRVWKDLVRRKVPKLVDHMNSELSSLIPTVCRKLEFDQLLYAATHPVTVKVTGYTVRFTVKSPRTAPLEMLGTFGAGILEYRGVYVNTIIQTSRFAPWIEQCYGAVTAQGGNHHFCDCTQPPDGGWESVKLKS